MHSLTEKIVIDAPVSDVWSAWDDYGNIARFNPNLNGSHLIGDSSETGMGATRQCNLSDGKNHIRERIVEYVHERKMVVDIYEGTVPLKTAKAQIDLTPLSGERTQVTFTLAFVPKMGLLGRLLVPMMKSQFRKSVVKLLDGARAYVERGTVVNAA